MFFNLVSDLVTCLQKHIDANADITVSCVPMDNRYVFDLSFQLFQLQELYLAEEGGFLWDLRI